MVCLPRDYRGSMHYLPWLGLAVVLAGCTNMSMQPRTTASNLFDSPAPLGAPDDYTARRPVTPSPKTPKRSPKPRKGESLPLPIEEDADTSQSDLDEPPASVRLDIAPKLDKRQSPKIESGPTIEPDEVTVAEPLELTVAAPARRQLGGVVTYRVTLRNISEHPLERLVVRCQFDRPLVFLGSDQRELLRRVERLSPGESKTLAISLTCDKTGSQCSRFTVSRLERGADLEVASREVCVDFVARHVEIEMLGPAQRTEGSRAEFNITLSNRSQNTIENVQAVISYDKALILKEASAEAEQKNGSLAWRLGALRPGDIIQLQVEFECRIQMHRACVTVDVKGANLPDEHEEGCVEIVPVPGTLDLRISDRDDPLEPGRAGTYDVTVQNIGLQGARGIVLEALVPENVRLRSATVRLDQQPLSLKYAAEANKLIFDRVELLEPNGRLTYSFEVEALRPGPAEFRASLTSTLSSTAVTVIEPTMIAEP